MNSPWEILGISETSDTRDIKRAYSRNLKVTRPDENPEAFQELHAAYKSALIQAEWLDDDSEIMIADVPLDEASGAYVSASDINYSVGQLLQSADDEQQETSKTLKQTPEDREQEVVFAKLSEELQKLLKNSSAIHILENWHFLQKHPDMFQHEFKIRLGSMVLEQLVNHSRMNSSKKRKHRQQSIQVLGFLDDTFLWRTNYIEYAALNPEADLVNLLAKLPDPEDYPDFFEACFTYGGNAFVQRFASTEHVSLNVASPIIRLISGAIDLTLVGIVMLLIATPLEVEFMPYGLWISVAITTFIMAFLEYTLEGITPGKYVLGLKVLTRNLTNITVWHALARAVVSCAYFLGCTYIVLGGKDVLDIGLSNWLIPWLGGWLVYQLTGGSYPHDFLSGTIVINEEDKGVFNRHTTVT